jgi:hypothetical protein
MTFGLPTYCRFFQATSQQELIKERLAAKLDASHDGKLSINRANLK